ncbi:uncharacterized protein A1O5_03273 [Cladophialophora psammophila CBS 110553]|uniref:Secreted protein n=1 Tax=Cladophialophora psammophila CBS 110553 TaxID=1182543 RepID=W9WZ69_9EURO|nr:uncharacterized protein A1O5_03273 [Cladophialophora psammophila CBS 110553]EXJ73512.1 hypothetical protein A1O5_03273 [Cladophialophora psammophila CBS 110553]
MKFLATTTAASAGVAVFLSLSLSASLASAAAIGDPSGLSAIANTFSLGARGLKKMDGKCTSSGGCKVPGGLHSAYPCWNSICNVTTHNAGAVGPDKGKNCTIAPGMGGAWVAKCPTNLLPYEWEWPWVPPRKDDGKGKGDSGKD